MFLKARRLLFERILFPVCSAFSTKLNWMKAAWWDLRRRFSFSWSFREADLHGARRSTEDLIILFIFHILLIPTGNSDYFLHYPDVNIRITRSSLISCVFGSRGPLSVASLPVLLSDLSFCAAVMLEEFRFVVPAASLSWDPTDAAKRSAGPTHLGSPSPLQRQPPCPPELIQFGEGRRSLGKSLDHESPAESTAQMSGGLTESGLS